MNKCVHIGARFSRSVPVTLFCPDCAGHLHLTSDGIYVLSRLWGKHEDNLRRQRADEQIKQILESTEDNDNDRQ